MRTLSDAGDTRPGPERERALRIEAANLALTLRAVGDDLRRLERSRTHRLTSVAACALHRLTGRRPLTRGALDRALRRLEALEAAGERPARPVEQEGRTIVLCTGAGPGRSTGTGGDVPFAEGFAAALSRQGWRASVTPYRGTPTVGGDVVVHLRGREARLLRPEAYNVLWIISHPEEVTPAECDVYDLVLVASALDAPRIEASTRAPVRVLDQAAGPDVFGRPRDKRDVPVVFVGNRREGRPRVEGVAAAVPELQVWGAGWDGVLSPGQWRGPALQPSAVADLYARSLVVLSDHWPAMRERGYLSNRVYEGLAAGAWVVSDAVAGVEPGRFGGALSLCGSVEEAVSRVRELVDRGTPAPAAVSVDVRREHGFDQRAGVLLGWLAGAVAPS